MNRSPTFIQRVTAIMAASNTFFLFTFLFFLGVHVAQCQLRLASYYSDHMVLQRGPQRAVIWGTASRNGDTVTAQVRGQGSAVTGTVQNGAWKLKLPAVTSTEPHVITVSSSEGTVTLNDVLFGDVWLCSGQSNMEFSMSQVMNSSAEIQTALNFPTIRFVKVSHARSDTEQQTAPLDHQWTVPTTQTLNGFSAVCWLFAEYIQPHLNYPLGLVEASWGGTTIEAWSPPEAINACPPVHHSSPEPECCPYTSQVLWNGMINPLLEMTIFGALWYQGESNWEQTDLYKCQIREMVRQWRAQFNSESMGETSNNFPFGYVQLAGYQNNNDVGSFPDIRWSQTAGYGYSPNPDLPNTFMAVAMDLPDFTSPYDPIHPRYKQDIAQRLMLGALNIAYGHSEVIFQGPFPTGFVEDRAAHTLTIEYDNGRTPLLVQNNNGFEVCCSSNPNTCDSQGTWEVAPITSHDTSHVTISYSGCGTRRLVGLRYAWRTSPCPLKQCAIYASDSELPAPPYITTSPPA